MVQLEPCTNLTILLLNGHNTNMAAIAVHGFILKLENEDGSISGPNKRSGAGRVTCILFCFKFQIPLSQPRVPPFHAPGFHREFEPSQ